MCVPVCVALKHGHITQQNIRQFEEHKSRTVLHVNKSCVIITSYV